jgi:hypothetical protein
MTKTPEQIFDWLNANGQADIVEYITQLHNQIRLQQTKPLSDDEIVNIWEKANYESKYYEASDNFAIEFARAIEERHGIK